MASILLFRQGVKVAVKELESQKLHVNRELLLEIKQVRVHVCRGVTAKNQPKKGLSR